MADISAEELRRLADCSADGDTFAEIQKAHDEFTEALARAWFGGLLVHADEVREVLAMVGNALNAAFAAGMEEREGGSGSRQGKELEKVETCRKAARALFAKLPPKGAKGE